MGAGLFPNPAELAGVGRGSDARIAPATRERWRVAATSRNPASNMMSSRWPGGALAERVHALRSGSTAVSAPDRALFDVGLSVAAARMLRAAHNGRIDPATMHWGCQIERKVVDPFGLLKEVRDGKGLAATLDALQPPFPHCARARRTLATYRTLAKAGEPEAVPDLPERPDQGGTRQDLGSTCRLHSA